MNVHAKLALRRAIDNVDMAASLCEEAATSISADSLYGSAYAEVLRAKGELAALAQLVDLEEQVAGKPQLRVVR